jgi:hypothetical protein
MSVVRLPSWSEVLAGPWALRLRAGAAGAWLMRSAADDAHVDCRFLAGTAARTAVAARLELESAFELEAPLARWDELADLAPPVALLVLDADRLLEEEPTQLAPLVAALRDAAERNRLRVVFQARELPPDAEAVLSEFGVAEITT